MSFQANSTENNCPRGQIAAYIEGDLSPEESSRFEEHRAVCTACVEELNEQKKFLSALDLVLVENDSEIRLPGNFTEVVVANAESNVTGLRRPQERFNAVFVCSALFVLVLLGLREETSGVLTTGERFLDQVFAVGGFAFNLVHDFAIGIAIVSKSLCHRFIFKSAVSLAFLLIFFLLAFFAVSRLLVRPGPGLDQYGNGST
jgi:hypothetical protein